MDFETDLVTPFAIRISFSYSVIFMNPTPGKYVQRMHLQFVGIHPLIDALNDSRLTQDLRFSGNISFQMMGPKTLNDLSP